MLILTGGREFDIEKEDVMRQAADLEPAYITRKGFYVRIDDNTFVAKNLVSAVTNLPEEELTTLDAYYILAKLGFDVCYCRPQKRSNGNDQE